MRMARLRPSLFLFFRKLCSCWESQVYQHITSTVPPGCLLQYTVTSRLPRLTHRVQTSAAAINRKPGHLRGVSASYIEWTVVKHSKVVPVPQVCMVQFMSNRSQDRLQLVMFLVAN